MKGGGLSGCFANHPAASCVSRPWNPAFGNRFLWCLSIMSSISGIHSSRAVVRRHSLAGAMEGGRSSTVPLSQIPRS